MTTLKRHGEWWTIRPCRRGWEAECRSLAISAKAATYEALMDEIDYLFEALCV